MSPPKERIGRKYAAALLIALYLCTLLFTSAGIVWGREEDSRAVVEGRVVEAPSGRPLDHALVVIERVVRGRRSAVDVGGQIAERISGYTDKDGFYRLEVAFDGECWIFALSDDPGTPGMDYLPGFLKINIVGGNTYNASFNLFPGASLRFNVEDVSFIQEPDPWRKAFSFQVSPSHGELGFNSSLLEYGSLYGVLIGLEEGDVVIPAGCPVTVRLEATAYRFFWKNITHILTLDTVFNLAQGEMEEIDLRPLSLGYNLNLTRASLQNVSQGLKEAEERGVYVQGERRDINTAEDLLALSEENLADASFDESYANLRQAYLIVGDVQDRINFIYATATIATIGLIPFLAGVSLSLASLLFERRSRKILSFLLFSLISMTAMSLFYVGFRLVEPWVIAADLLLSIMGCLTLPFIFKEVDGDRDRPSPLGVVVSVFSLAKRNLRRRRFRTSLVVASLLVMVASFISLTSFDMGYGLVVDHNPTYWYQAEHGPPPREGLLIKKPPSNQIAMTNPFLPLHPPVIRWLSQREDVKVIAPKAENQPSLYPKFSLTSSKGERVFIGGVMRIVPSKEVQVTLLDKIIKYGSFLSDDDERGVLIGEGAAERLGVEPGDILKLSEVDIMGNPVRDLGEYRLAGIFDGGLLKKVYDLDGRPILPKVLTRFAMHIFWTYCDPDDSAIFTLPSALKLPSVSLSRVDVLPEDLSDIPSLSRLAVLNLGVEVWEALSGDVLHYFVGRYMEMKGLSFIVPFLLVIGNIFSLMISSVYERRKEIYIMSTLGLSPTHIASIFLAEGLILGFISGGLGYLIGLGSYRVISLLPFPVEVVQKVSLGWAFMAVVVALAASMAGSLLPALKASLLTTPSLTRRWRLKEAVEKGEDCWKIHLPIYMEKEEAIAFSNYLRAELKRFEEDFRRVEDIRYREGEEGEAPEVRISFTYTGYPEEDPTRRIVADNEVLITPSEKPQTLTIYLLYYGSRLGRKRYFLEDDAHIMASIIRKIALGWSAFTSSKGFLKNP